MIFLNNTDVFIWVNAMDKQIYASRRIHLCELTWWNINKTCNDCYSIDHTGYVRTAQDNSIAPNCRQTITITNAKSTQ